MLVPITSLVITGESTAANRTTAATPRPMPFQSVEFLNLDTPPKKSMIPPFRPKSKLDSPLILHRHHRLFRRSKLRLYGAYPSGFPPAAANFPNGDWLCQLWLI